MTENSKRLQLAFQRIDDANAGDPNQVDGISSELLYSQRMTAWLGKLYPQASESLQLAARAQHIRRWEIPRNNFPMDRAGYHRWRTTLYGFHADITAKILAEVHYDEQTITRVKSLLKKELLKTSAETQALEDVICVVFLENYSADFSVKHDREKLIGILKRTWAKMSPIGQQAALKLPLPPEISAMIAQALK